MGSHRAMVTKIRIEAPRLDLSRYQYSSLRATSWGIAGAGVLADVTRSP